MGRQYKKDTTPKLTSILKEGFLQPSLKKRTIQKSEAASHLQPGASWVFLLFLFLASINFIWMSENSRPYVYFAEAGAYEEYRDFMQKGLANFDREPISRILYYFTANVLGNNEDALRTSNLIVVFIYIFSIYGICTTLFDKRTAVLSAFFASTYPGMLYFSRSSFIAYHEAAMVALCLFALLKTDGFTSKRWSVILGLCVWAIFLTRFNQVVYIISPAAVVLFIHKRNEDAYASRFWKMSRWQVLSAAVASVLVSYGICSVLKTGPQGIDSLGPNAFPLMIAIFSPIWFAVFLLLMNKTNRPQNAILSAAISIGLCLPLIKSYTWMINHSISMMPYVPQLCTRHPAIVKALIYLIFLPLNAQMGFIGFVLFIISSIYVMGLCFRRKIAGFKLLFLASWMLPALMIYTLLPIKNERITLPGIAVCAIILAKALMSMENRRWRVAFITLAIANSLSFALFFLDSGISIDYVDSRLCILGIERVTMFNQDMRPLFAMNSYPPVKSYQTSMPLELPIDLTGMDRIITEACPRDLKENSIHFLSSSAVVNRQYLTRIFSDTDAGGMGAEGRILDLELKGPEETVKNILQKNYQCVMIFTATNIADVAPATGRDERRIEQYFIGEFPFLAPRNYTQNISATLRLLEQAGYTNIYAVDGRYRDYVPRITFKKDILGGKFYVVKRKWMEFSDRMVLMKRIE